MSTYIVTIIWFILFALSFFIKNENTRYRNNKDKTKIVLIMIILYYIIYYLSGLIFGFSNSPYSHKFTEIVKNVINIFLVKLIQEYLRTKILTKKKNFILYLVVTISFIAINIDYQTIYTLDQALKFILSEILPNTAESILLTYLSINGGYILNFAYTIPKNIVIILAPIFPEINWFFDSVLKYTMFLLIFLFVNYEQILRKTTISRKQIRRENPIKNLPIVTLIIVLVCFIIGIFPYKPVSIVSNSMSPAFSRGDIVIIKKYNKEQLNLGDIIEYELNGIYIVHRIVKIQRGILEEEYVTKGDNNLTHDLLPVEKEKIVGIVKFRIPYLGYPAVFFTEILTRIEM